jgi:7,8-dihydro-6-hydroxymethylpterin-pyrophosphokinase
MAVRGETHLAPETLLQHVKYIEHKLGRQPRGEWGPREIDIDILSYEDKFIETGDLTIPHKHLCERPFALVPLADITPNWRFPGHSPCKGKTAFELAEKHRSNLDIRKTDLIIERRKEPALSADAQAA